MPALRIDNLGKSYKIYASPRARLKTLLTGRGHHTLNWALSEVSLVLERGQCLGVVGDNGAGKSTLLKLIAGTLQPSTGGVLRNGRLTAILELGAGFHPEFSGRDNLYFGGALIGISEQQMASLEAGIVDFAELQGAIERPVKTYSSGMVVRLAFALVTAIEPDILIIDEALAVGDQHFQKKCVERIDNFRRNGCTILFCSHSLYHVRQLCDVALWLDGGRPRAFGPTERVLASYETHVRALDGAAVDAPAKPAPRAAQAVVTPDRRAGILDVAVAGLEVDKAGADEVPLLQADDLAVTVTAYVNADERPSIGVMLEQVNGVGITSVATHADGAAPRQLADGRWQATVTFPDLPLHTGEYMLSAYLFDSHGIVVYEEWGDCLRFKFVHPTLTPGLVRLPHIWS